MNDEEAFDYASYVYEEFRRMNAVGRNFRIAMGSHAGALQKALDDTLARAAAQASPVVLGQARRDIAAGETIRVALDLMTEIELTADGKDIAVGPALAPEPE